MVRLTSTERIIDKVGWSILSAVEELVLVFLTAPCVSIDKGTATRSVRTHDRAPPATSQVQPGIGCIGGRVVAARDVEIWKAIVVHIHELPAIRPADASDILLSGF